MRLILDGDVAGGVNAARFDSRVDMCAGIGGTPEGVITACAVKALGGQIQGQLWPTSPAERERALDAGHDLDAILDQDDLVRSDNAYFVATGITPAEFVNGVKPVGGKFVRTESVVMRSHSGTIRHVVSDMLIDRWND